MNKLEVFAETRKEILSREGVCFGISCKDCPLGYRNKKTYDRVGLECRGGGNGNYSGILSALNNLN